jgi:hypothetical protein
VIERNRFGWPMVVRLPTGERGYYQTRNDDCMRAAVATCLQVPIEDVPDPRLDERLAAGDDPDELDRLARAELEGWLAGRGLRLVRHWRLPVDRERWIGVSPGPGEFGDHVLVMTRAEILFDPASYIPGMERLARLRPLSYGITFDREET